MLDTNSSPSPGRLDRFAGHRVQYTAVLSTRIKGFDFAMQTVPRVETIATPASPTPLTVDITDINAAIQKPGFGNRLPAHSILRAPDVGQDARIILTNA
jgi:hypothetical protein